MTTPQPIRDVHDLFDRTLKHLLTVSHPMIVGAINGMFDTDFPLNSEVTFENTEEVNENLGSLTSDTKIRINKRNRFIIEAEIAPNKPIALKIFREAFEDAIRNKIDDDCVIHLPFPDVRVIYFEPNAQTPDIVTIRMETQDGRSFDYPVKSFKPTEHRLQELSDRNLDIFLPFYILKFRKKLEKCKTDADRAPIADEMRQMLTEMVEIIERKSESGAITLEDAYTLLNHIDNMWEQLYGTYPEIREVDEMVVKNPIITRWDRANAERERANAEKWALEVQKAREDEHNRTREEDQRTFVINLRKRKIPDDEIASIVNLPVERVREIRA